MLVRDTLYGDLTRLRRVRMHARLAEALRQLRPADVGELCQRLGRREEAIKHFRHAERVARRWGSAHWAADARSALAAI